MAVEAGENGAQVTSTSTGIATHWVLDADNLDRLIEALLTNGYEVFGPTVRDGAIAIAEIHRGGDLPRGRNAAQGPGSYRLREHDDPRYFQFVHGADSWKRLFLPPEELLWVAERTGDRGFEVRSEPHVPRKKALFGVRACDLAALASLDRVMLEVENPDAGYAARRDGTFIVAVDCAEPGGTCFCASLGTGPQVDSRFDLRLTEIYDAIGHRFLVTAGSSRGLGIVSSLSLAEAEPDDLMLRVAQGEAAAARMGRSISVDGLSSKLLKQRESQRFEKIAERCLSCGNCTAVCPTCFCTTIEDTLNLAGDTAKRRRRWDSCFSLNFSYINGGFVRESGGARYRQWLLHKLATWETQFGGLGCVGCGRCVTWCPVGIDLTAEATELANEAIP